MPGYSFSESELLISTELSDGAVAAINREDFKRAEFCPIDDWQRYVPYAYRAAWKELHQETRNAIYIMASMIALAFEWE